MDDTVKRRIDGTELEVESGMTLLEAAESVGIFIPYLCHHPDLKPFGVCRICMVEIEGTGLTLSCLTPAEDGMVVRTESDSIDHVRRIAVELLLVEPRWRLPRCAQERPLHAATRGQLRGDRQGSTRPARGAAKRPCRSTPRIRFSTSITASASSAASAYARVRRSRRERTRLRLPRFQHPDQHLRKQGDQGLALCLLRRVRGPLPRRRTGAEDYPAAFARSQNGLPLLWRGLQHLSGRAGQPARQFASGTESPVNQGRLCVKGRFGYEFINHPDRLTTPLIRKNGDFVEASWDEALDLVAEVLLPKGDRFGALPLPSAPTKTTTWSRNSLRAVMGTNNVDHCARL